MKLQIPDIGDKLVLSDWWDFFIHYEYRNEGFLNGLLGKKKINVWNCNGKKMAVRLPPKTVLSVDRVYIRKGANDFSSITFRIESVPTPERIIPLWQKLLKKRFWAKLSDVNKMQIEETDLANIKHVPPIEYSNLVRFKKGEVYRPEIIHRDKTESFSKSNLETAVEIVSIYTREIYKDREVFKVNVTLHLERERYESTRYDGKKLIEYRNRIKQADYELKSLKGKTLFETHDQGALRKKIKELLEKSL